MKLKTYLSIVALVHGEGCTSPRIKAIADIVLLRTFVHPQSHKKLPAPDVSPGNFLFISQIK